MLPFTAEQFFELFAAYNRAIWPSQIVAYALGIVALGGLAMRRPAGGRIAMAVLGVFWLWNGVVYHLMFFTSINKAAYGFAALFVVESLLFFGVAAYGKTPARSLRWSIGTVLGGALIVYATLIYGILGSVSGHPWPRAPMFGVAPCPTTIFTFGVLLVWTRPLPRWLIVIPLIWAAVGSTAAILLSVPEDLGLLAGGLAAAGWLVFPRDALPTALRS